MAGQFAKPRSAADRDDRRRRAAVLPRRHHQRLRLHAGGAQSRSAADAAGLYPGGGDAEPAARLLDQGGYADIHRVHSWTLGFIAEHDKAERYRELANRISEALDFMDAAGVNSRHRARAATGWISTPATRRCCWSTKRRCAGSTSITGQPVAGSGHMIWIGDRTRQPDGAHVEFARGVQNPIGLKCGPSTTAERPEGADRPS